MAALHAANNFFESSKPWTLKAGAPDGNQARLETIIAMTMDALRLSGIVLQPIIPQLANRLLDKLSVPTAQRGWNYLAESFATSPNSSNSPAGLGESRQLDGQTSALLFQRILEETSAKEVKEQKPQPAKRSKSKKKERRETMSWSGRNKLIPKPSISSRRGVNYVINFHLINFGSFIYFN